MSLEFVKINCGRKRFVKTTALDNFINWQSDLVQLKNFLALHTGLQIMSPKIHFEMNFEHKRAFLMLQVVGVPIATDTTSLTLFDFENMEAFVCELDGIDLFSVDIDTLFRMSIGSKQALEANLLDLGDKISPFFHIVFDQCKIGLHFFKQKDYIQNQL